MGTFMIEFPSYQDGEDDEMEHLVPISMERLPKSKIQPGKDLGISFEVTSKSKLFILFIVNIT